MKGLIVVAMLLAGCASPHILSSTPRSVVVDDVNENSLDEAARIAQRECEKHGRDAEQVTGDDIARGLHVQSVTFKCVDRTAPATRDSQ